MKSKKLLAIVTAIALIALQVPVAFAAGTDAGGIVGEGVVNYIDPMTVVDTVVPTSTALAFTLDPQNLAAVQGVGEWDPAEGGSIIPASVVTIGNKSAIPVKVSIDFTLVDDAEDVVLLDNAGDVNDGTDKNMYLSFVPSNAKTTIETTEIAEATDPTFVQDGGSDATFDEADLLAAGVDAEDLLESTEGATATFGQFVETDVDSGTFNQVEVPVHAAVPATTQTSISEYETLRATDAAAVMTDAVEGTSLAYVLNKAAYYVVRDSDGFTLRYDGAARNDNYDTASFVISGLINKNADWSGYNAETKITVSATYSFDKLTDDAYTTALTGKVTDTYNSVATAPPAPSTYTITVNDDGNGTASADLASAEAGATVTLTATPDEGYHFAAWEVDSPADLVIEDDTFTMPAENVTVTATFEADPIGFTGDTAFTYVKASLTAGTTIVVPFNFGGKSITSVGLTSPANIPFVEGTDYSKQANSITILYSRLSVFSTGAKTITIVVDGQNFNFTITPT